MPKIKYRHAVSGRSLKDVWNDLISIDRLPTILNDVLNVQYTDSDKTTRKWDVNFNGSILSWTETVEFFELNKIVFKRTEGVIKSFEGEVTIYFDDTEDIIKILIYIDFNVGIPGLGEMLNPIILNSINENLDLFFKKKSSSRGLKK